jgi:hypothetical protein
VTRLSSGLLVRFNGNIESINISKQPTIILNTNASSSKPTSTDVSCRSFIKREDKYIVSQQQYW